MMSQSDAAWVREQVWTPAMRATHAETPGLLVSCPCEWQGDCQHGEQCARREPLVRPIGDVLRPGGEDGAYHAEPYTHPTPTAVGAQHTRQAQLWYADRTCRWVCECECHTAPDPADVLAFVQRRGLVDADHTIADLTPPAYRAYAQERLHQLRRCDRERREGTRSQAQQQRAADADRAYRAKRDRKDDIRTWARENGWKITNGRIPARVEEAYAVQVEDADGQAALF